MRMTLIYPIFGDVCRLCPSVSRYVPLRNRQLPTTVPDHIVESQAEHEAVAAAIRADDAEAAERLMPQHVIAVKPRVLLAATRRRNPPTSAGIGPGHWWFYDNLKPLF